MEISIHALLAESDRATKDQNTIRVISIHALLAESDLLLCLFLPFWRAFLSTLSLRRATLTERRHWQVGQISIHALLAESDW